MSSPNANITNTLLQSEGKFMPTDSATKWWIRSGTTQYLASGESAAHDAKPRFYMPISYTEPFGDITQVTYYGSYYMMLETTQDALGNQSSVSTFNFRTLAAQRLKDINGNYSEAIADELGLVKALAVFGKGSEADDLTGLHEYTDTTESGHIHDFLNVPLTTDGVTDYVTLTTKANTLLQHATTRFVYDFDRYKNTGKPAVVSSIVREQHYQVNNNSPLQISFEYSDGMGRVAMKKVQAEGGDAKQVIVHTDDSIIINTLDTSALSTPQLRWIGNGKTIVNNKGNVVKQYEPYFSVTNGYEDFKELVESGVTPVLYYDAAGRLIRTDMPDGTYSRVEFDSWKQLVYDANDTVLDSEWYLKRTVSTHAGYISDAKEQAAAAKAAAHANTPNVLHFDTLGRPVLSLDYYDDITTQPTHCYATQIALDIESNLHTVTDARGNAVMTYKYDMLGHLVYQKSMDSGEKWLLINAVLNPLRTWDADGRMFSVFYDVLHRPTSKEVLDSGTKVLEQLTYGEGQTNDQLLNLRGKVCKHADGAGYVTMDSYDFKGNVLSQTRKFAVDKTQHPNWGSSVSMESDSYTTSNEYDALNRHTKITTPDNGETNYQYTKEGLLKGVDISGVHSLTTDIINNIIYNEKGQRIKVQFENGASTMYEYDTKIFRVKRIKTIRSNDSAILQDLNYWYDAIGNITFQSDDAQQTVYFNNNITNAGNDYTYDPLYRLTQAIGREHASNVNTPTPLDYNDADRVQQTHKSDETKMVNYTELFEYDETGNVKSVKHYNTTGTNRWTKNFTYKNTIIGGNTVDNNRLDFTQIGTNNGTKETYTYDSRGNIIGGFNHLISLAYNAENRLETVVVNNNITTYYQYDAAGQRVRKTVVNTNGSTTTQVRKYIGGWEVYSNFDSANTITLQRETLHIMDDKTRVALVDSPTIDTNSTGEVQLLRYQFSNHLSSATLELDDAAAIVSYEEYYPFGNTSFQSGRSTAEVSLKRYRYTGKEKDNETGLYYHGARYYAPWLCRWIAVEPLESEFAPQSPYSYCMNNPVIHVDPDGKKIILAYIVAAPPDKEHPSAHLTRQIQAEYKDNKLYDMVTNQEIKREQYEKNEFIKQVKDSLDEIKKVDTRGAKVVQDLQDKGELTIANLDDRMVEVTDANKKGTGEFHTADEVSKVDGKFVVKDGIAGGASYTQQQENDPKAQDGNAKTFIKISEEKTEHPYTDYDGKPQTFTTSSLFAKDVKVAPYLDPEPKSASLAHELKHAWNKLMDIFKDRKDKTKSGKIKGEIDAINFENVILDALKQAPRNQYGTKGTGISTIPDNELTQPKDYKLQTNQQMVPNQPTKKK